MNELKVQELERRIKLLEEQESRPVFNYYSLSKSSILPAQKHVFDYCFNLKSNCYLMLESAVNGAIDGFSVLISINGSDVCCLQNCQKQTAVNKLLPFASGKNIVSITVTFSSPSTVESCSLKTFGNLTYLDEPTRLSVLNESDKSIILYLSNNVLTVGKYQGEILSQLNFSGVNDGAISKLGDDYLLVLVDEGGNATAYLYDSQFSLLNSANLDAEIHSICSTGGNPAMLFGVKGNRVYSYQVYQDLSVVIAKTEHRAKSLTANASISDYLIITDHAGNGKLIKI